MSDEFVTLETFSRGFIAYIAKAKLAAAGIDSFVADEHMNIIYPGLTGVRLLVREKDLEEARNVLQETDGYIDRVDDTNPVETASGIKETRTIAPILKRVGAIVAKLLRVLLGA